jgi:hypothetical protein
VMLLSYLTSSTSARQSAAWGQYSAALETPIYNDQMFNQAMQILKLSAEENAGTPVQQWADVAWADGQLWMGSRAFLVNRTSANEMLNRAGSVYNIVLSTASDQRLLDRANLGLGRLYEMRNDLDKAKQHYADVKSEFVELAQLRIQQIDNRKDKLSESLSWLATADLPQRVAPTGPGTPGQRPDFSAGDLKMPAASPTTTESGPSFDDIFNSVDQATQSSDESRYEDSGDATGEDAATESTDAKESETSAP